MRFFVLALQRKGLGMTLFHRLQRWWQVQTGQEDPLLDRDAPAFLVSLVFHLVVLLVLGLLPLAMPDRQITLVIPPPEDDLLIEDLQMPKDFSISDRLSLEVGTPSVADFQMAQSMAERVSEVPNIPSPIEITYVEHRGVDTNFEIQIATGHQFSDNVTVKGSTGEAVADVHGAMDRLTYEILRSLEDRKTLVVWLFDQSGSLKRQRQEIYDRFDRIYEELGVIEAAGNPAFAKHQDKPLLTSIVAFGQAIRLMTREPTDDLGAIKAAVAAIEDDESGIERVFSAVHMSVDRYRHFRLRHPVTNQPERNVMIIVFTDERGDDLDGAEPTIDLCRRYGVPVYVVGSPAPFGRIETYMKWVDPDPQYDQTPQWGVVDQGPESLMLERLNLRTGSSADELQTIDSGFGPFHLTRLCYETGGIFFSVHPNRNVYRELTRGETSPFTAHIKHFFDPHVMRRYRPEYVSRSQYLRQAQANPSRAALLAAANQSWNTSIENARLRFIRRDQTSLARAFSEARKDTAQAQSHLMELYATLQAAEAARDRESTPRWQAGYDLAMGQVLSALARTEARAAMLTQAIAGMGFTNPSNNTWVLEPVNRENDDLASGQVVAKARSYLQRVIDQHPDTPWALIARHELLGPVGWRWIEEFTDLSPRGPGAGGAGGGGGDGRHRRDDGRPVRRPVPKL